MSGVTGGMTASAGAEAPPEQDAAQATAGDGVPVRVAHGALRGVVAAFAMTGLRSLTVNLGLVKEPPPRAIIRQKSHGIFRVAPKRPRRVAQELFHCGVGAAGGVTFALLPEEARLQPWAGPVFGVAVWLTFELGLAPVLGLSQAKRPRPLDRVALAADHVLYGFVLSETRRRPRE